MKFFIVIAATLSGCTLLDAPPSPPRDCSMSDISGPVIAGEPTDLNDLVRRRRDAERLGYCKAKADET